MSSPSMEYIEEICGAREANACHLSQAPECGARLVRPIARMNVRDVTKVSTLRAIEADRFLPRASGLGHCECGARLTIMT